MNLPADEVPQALTDTQPRSSIEVFLGGVQSIGSWQSFLIYAVIAGIIVWIGLYTNSVFLLVASMLIAPFGGPAMNVAISSLFLLLLQLVGINIACAIVFRLYELTPRGPIYARGRRQFFPIAMGLSGLALALLLGWQFLFFPQRPICCALAALRGLLPSLKKLLTTTPMSP